ncbi:MULTISPECIES: ParA family protein [unclassified Arthrobacter]|uniref:ParA family protein n=1 Tax=unclassified Arthrobacter TaxID=235627 RepID=UPI0024DFE837|nr:MULTISPECIES: ParA family protein [unclassified Arthrobacter]MCC9145013.1 ParA family protein [Arthrobacter sp. zg-Y919]MDK1276241.1 ParA family protein [Arthrobacter sp. zg.Y919]MDM7988880.1 ParA family protein [Arthrobacter sp. zg-Y877]WIB02148.1 ParA family protein [Arthrobacter sp. zg-Y919]
MQVVSISSLKGGVGKTSVTLGLASAALAAGIPTLVVDLDPHADATTGLGVSAGNQLGIGEMLRSPRRIQLSDHVVPAGWVANARRLARDSGGKKPVLDVAMGSAYSGIYDRPDLGKRDLRRLTSLLSRVTGYGLVLIDCPPSLNGLTRMAWTASNRVLLVAEPGLFSVAGTERTMRALELFREEFAPNLAPAGIIANRVRPSSNEHVFRLAEMKQMFGDLLLSPNVAEQANWQQIQGAAHSVHHWPGESAKQAAGTFDALIKNLMDTGSVRNRVMRRPVA